MSVLNKEELPHLPYSQLFLLDILNGGQIAQYLNHNGFASKTVCPSCHVDDFTHVEGCFQNKWIFPKEDSVES